jgi:hypothetical protein
LHGVEFHQCFFPTTREGRLLLDRQHPAL